LTGIEAYLQEIPEEEADVDSVLDFVASTAPEDVEWNDEVRSMVRAEIERYLPEPVAKEVPDEEEWDDDDNEFDDLEDLEHPAPEISKEKVYPSVEDIELYSVGADKWRLVDKKWRNII
jgi:hypothetical protein